MTSFRSVEEFERYLDSNILKFKFINEKQKSVYLKLKKQIYNNIIKVPPETRRYSLIFYGSHGIGKTFLMRYLLKELEAENKLKSDKYVYCSYENLRNLITEEHKRLMYDNYNVEVIDNLILKIIKHNLFELNKDLIIFDNLSEKIFSKIDYTASDFLYNQNGKGVIWILSDINGLTSSIDRLNINLIHLNDLITDDLEVFLDRYFRDLNIKMSANIKNLNELLQTIKNMGF